MRSRWLSFLVLLFLLALLFRPFAVARALDPRSGERVVIAAGEVVKDDLYVAASELVIEGEVDGDVYFMGSTLTITGKVTGDVNAFGGAILLKGEIGDDLRFFGAVTAMEEGARVGGDLIAFGRGLNVQAGSTIGQDLVFYGGQAYLGGEVGRNVRLGVNDVMLAGHVHGNADLSVMGERGASSTPPIFGPMPVEMPSLPGGLTLDPSARVDGDLKYQAVSPLADVERNVGGKVEYVPFESTQETKTQTAFDAWLNALRSLVTLMLFGALFAAATPGFLQQSATKIREQFWPSLGWGVLAYAIFFFLLLGLFVLMILAGVFFGILTLGSISALVITGGLLLILVSIFVFVFVTAYLTKIVVGWELGNWLVNRFLPQWSGQRYAPLVGVFLFGLVLQVPYLGFVLGLAALFIGLGALWLVVRPGARPLRATP
jgi:cytoskeletal protein CcmA (bactofilin family)